MRQQATAAKLSTREQDTVNLRDDLASAFKTLLFSSTPNRETIADLDEDKLPQEFLDAKFALENKRCSTEEKINYIRKSAFLAFPTDPEAQVMAMRYLALRLRKERLIAQSEINQIAEAIAQHSNRKDPSVEEGLSQIIAFSMHLNWDLQFTEKLELAVLIANRLFPLLQDPELLQASQLFSGMSTQKRNTIKIALSWFNSGFQGNLDESLKLVSKIKDTIG